MMATIGMYLLGIMLVVILGFFAFGFGSKKHEEEEETS